MRVRVKAQGYGQGVGLTDVSGYGLHLILGLASLFSLAGAQHYCTFGVYIAD